MPRPITWCKAPGVSNLACLGIAMIYDYKTIMSSFFRTNVPFFTHLTDKMARGALYDKHF
jgi:hypothetical protein